MTAPPVANLYALSGTPGSGQEEFEPVGGPTKGRVILLVTAYAPVAVIVGLRALPGLPGRITLIAGLLGVLLWIGFLKWLPDRQPSEEKVERAEYVDSEVTGYIVSILLPVVAASKPDASDWAAYGVCAALILVVAYAAELWSVNPIAYLFGLRPARALVEGERQIVLVRGPLGADGMRPVIRRLGVILVLEPERTGTQDAS